VGVSESWTNDSIGDKEVGLEEYELFHRDRAVEGKGGGVLLYIKNVLRARLVKWRNQFPEHVWCKVKCENHDVYMVVCYRTATDGVYGQGAHEKLRELIVEICKTFSRPLRDYRVRIDDLFMLDENMEGTRSVIHLPNRTETGLGFSVFFHSICQT